MTKSATYEQTFRRGLLRSAFHSLFWGVLVDRKRNSDLKMQDIADSLGVNKSFVSRSFSSPPNWRIETLADFSDALDLDLIIEARDRKTGRIFTPSGVKAHASTTTTFDVNGCNVQVSITSTEKSGRSLVSASL